MRFIKFGMILLVAALIAAGTSNASETSAKLEKRSVTFSWQLGSQGIRRFRFHSKRMRTG